MRLVLPLLFFCAFLSLGDSASTVEVNATADGNSTLPGTREDSFADIIDRALEKEFNETDQNESSDPGSFNNSVAGQQCYNEASNDQPKKLTIFAYISQMLMLDGRCSRKKIFNE